MIKTLTAILLLAAALFACKKQAPAPPPPQQTQAAPAAQEAKPEEKKAAPAESYVYEAQGRRDPFFSIIESSRKERESAKKKAGAKATESFDVTDISVVAIAWDKKGYYAMLQLPDKKYFTVKEGTPLGIYGGKVVRISPDSIVVREQIKNYKGIVQPKDTILKLRKGEEE